MHGELVEPRRHEPSRASSEDPYDQRSATALTEGDAQEAGRDLAEGS